MAEPKAKDATRKTNTIKKKDSMKGVDLLESKLLSKDGGFFRLAQAGRKLPDRLVKKKKRMKEDGTEEEISYLQTRTVIEIMNSIWGEDWGTEHKLYLMDREAILGYAIHTNGTNHRWVFTAVQSKETEVGDWMMNAGSFLFKKACVMFGVGSYLYRDEELKDDRSLSYEQALQIIGCFREKLLPEELSMPMLRGIFSGQITEARAQHIIVECHKGNGKDFLEQYNKLTEEQAEKKEPE